VRRLYDVEHKDMSSGGNFITVARMYLFSLAHQVLYRATYV